MFKLTSFFLLLWLVMVLLSSIVAGGGGFVITALTQNETADATTFHVVSTTGMLSASTVQVGSEIVTYTGLTSTTLTGLTRGANGTTAIAHASGAQVYTEDAGALNSALGFSIPQVADSMGILSIVAVPVMFLSTTIPRAIAYNYNFLLGDMAIFGMIFYILGAAWIFTLAWGIIGSRRV